MRSIQHTIFRQLILSKLRNKNPMERKQKQIRPPFPIYPTAIERQYGKDIKGLMNQLIERLMAMLTQENYERWIQDYNKHDSIDPDIELADFKMDKVTLEKGHINFAKTMFFEEMIKCPSDKRKELQKLIEEKNEPKLRSFLTKTFGKSIFFEPGEKAGEEKGNWVTVKGNHVFIGADDWNIILNYFSFHSDDYENEVNRVIGTLEGIEDDVFSDKELSEITQKTLQATYFHSKGDWKKLTEHLTGVPFSTDEPWWAKTKKAWQNENITLIKSIAPEFIKKVSHTIYSGVRTGKLWQDMKNELLGIVGKNVPSKIKEEKKSTWINNKSTLIARDQIGKLNGQLSRYRQTEIGIDKYTWMAIGDERTCPICSKIDNKLLQWDDASVWSADGGKTWIARPSDLAGAIPGNAHPQCRCQAIAFIEEMMDDIEKGFDAKEEVEGDKVEEGSWVAVNGTPILLGNEGQVLSGDLELGFQKKVVKIKNGMEEKNPFPESIVPENVYHGTRKDFEQFNQNSIGDNYNFVDKGFFFTNDKKEAAFYTNSEDLDGNKFKGDSPNIKEAKINLENPFIKTVNESATNFFDRNKEKIFDYCEEEGKDGIIIKGNENNIYIVFKPDQIKIIRSFYVEDKDITVKFDHQDHIKNSGMRKGDDSAESPKAEDTELNDEIMSETFDILYKTTKIDNTHDIPYLAGYNIKRNKVYIDRRFPQFMHQGANKIDVWKYIVGHERIEDSIESQNPKLEYRHAHQLALRSEKEAVEADGWDWLQYDAFCKKYIIITSREEIKDVPDDLDLQPYIDEHDRAIIKQIIESKGKSNLKGSPAMPIKNPNG